MISFLRSYLKMIIVLLVILLAFLLITTPVECVGCYDYSIAASSRGSAILPSTIYLDVHETTVADCLTSLDCKAAFTYLANITKSRTQTAYPQCTFSNPIITCWEEGKPLFTDPAHVRMGFILTRSDCGVDCYVQMRSYFWSATQGSGEGNTCQI